MNEGGKRVCKVYSPYLMRAIVRKMKRGMDGREVERTYGIPAQTARGWLMRDVMKNESD